MLKTIIFDFDGTLADTIKLTLDCCNQVLAKHGYKTVENPDSLRQKGLKSRVKEWGIPLYKIPSLLSEGKCLMNKSYASVNLYHGMPELVQELYPRYTMGILTGNSEFMVKNVLKENLKFFEFIYCDTSLFGKNAKLKALLRKYHLNPDEAIYVGDELRDIEACRALKLRIISVSWGFNTPESLEKENPGLVAKDPEHLAQLIEKKE